MKLSEFASKKKVTTFEVASTQLVPREDGQKNAIFTLVNPIAHVLGSIRLSDDASGETAYLQDWNVETVMVSAENMDADGIDIDENGKGTVACDLRLDVSNKGDVWLTSKSFAALSNEGRSTRASERRSGNFSRMAEKRAKVELAGTDIPATKAANEAKAAAKPASVATAKA